MTLTSETVTCTMNIFPSKAILLICGLWHKCFNIIIINMKEEKIQIKFNICCNKSLCYNNCNKNFCEIFGLRYMVYMEHKLLCVLTIWKGVFSCYPGRWRSQDEWLQDTSGFLSDPETYKSQWLELVLYFNNL